MVPVDGSAGNAVAGLGVGGKLIHEALFGHLKQLLPELHNF
jgi:hypothetical protein